MSYKTTKGMKEEAERGLAWRSEFGRGGTEVGIARARDIVNDRNLSEDTVKRMFSFFSRHEVDKEAEGFNPGEDGYPSNGRIAWALWGGDAGFTWSKNIVDELKMEEERAVNDTIKAGLTKKVEDHNEEVGNVAAFLCSDLASGITGEITYVDAGFNTAAMSLEEFKEL